MTEFNKMDQVMYFVLHFLAERGKKDVGSIELMKHVYLIDCEAQRFLGKTITGVRWERQKNGPLTTEFYQARKRMKDHELRYSTPWGMKTHHNVTNANPRFDVKFDVDEETLIRSVLGDNWKLNTDELSALAYKTEPMVEMQARERTRKVPLLRGANLDVGMIELDPRMVAYEENASKDVLSNVSDDDLG